MIDMVEKRRFPRLVFQKPVQVFPVLPSRSGNIYEVQNKSVESLAYDISEGGLKLEADRSFDPNFLLKLNFSFFDEDLIEVFGKVVWTSEKRCGVRFMLSDFALRKGIRALSNKKDE